MNTSQQGRNECAFASGKKKNHFFQVQVIDGIHHILCQNVKECENCMTKEAADILLGVSLDLPCSCQTCGYPMVRPFCNNFMDQISEESMASLATRLIEKQPLNKAELRLAEHVKDVIFR